MAEDDGSRFETELDLLNAMYPDQISYNREQGEVRYRDNSSSLDLRIPSGYPSIASPKVTTATGPHGKDLRKNVAKYIESCPVGEESLDAIIAEFFDITQSNTLEPPLPEESGRIPDDNVIPAKKTVLVWLHHLLNTAKRKQVLASSYSHISGVSKPGYPGILVFSGQEEEVNEHVGELRRLNWQAFQVRFEEAEEWPFTHGKGVIEVETVGDVVKEVGEERKGIFMKAMRMI